MQYIAQVYGGSTGLYPASATEQALARQWLEFGEQYLVAKTNPVFFGAVRGRYAASSTMRLFGRRGVPAESNSIVPGAEWFVHPPVARDDVEPDLFMSPA